MNIILQKFIASSGFCSRRKAEELIKEGKVIVNKLIAEPGQTVNEDDVIKINGKNLKLPKEKIYIKLNKPVGYVCTNRMFFREKNVFELLPKEMNNLIITGRLDKNSHGLIILTNDGDWAEHLTHPRYEHEKEYCVKIYNLQFTSLKPEDVIKKLLKGVDIGEDEGIVKAKAVEYLGDNKFKIILTQGKKRQIRRMLKAIDLEVVDLIRVRVGDIKLDNLESGKWEFLKIGGVPKWS
ncbi:MAG: pseudouridine synthase [Patescibacteria group bacterium]|nr:rRNA pseudouridine synthase [Patescibacteria group bacterium]MBU0879238.1 rRNA pseudouridine synthase [Patescibacteria group bacterium]MBU0879917.1 rRNA pseudouridine synthase [Patescibacteria group bacterium]MBU0897857.1 rRNA pseudouridine synthase [Patescibacteria group bacterium]MBU1063002.1 rRNA pseudouridine synthase [Patescibacteria group bacterium]